ncbi:MAG: acyltransferase [Clostridia bacterium]|nr:acyltransferase [Clostridia bacterium]
MGNAKKFSKILNFQFKLFFSRLSNQGTIKTEGKLIKNRCALFGDFNCGKNSKIIIGRIDAAENFHISAISGGTLQLGKGVFINRNCTFVARESIKIGDKCSFGPNVCIYDHDHAFGTARKNGEYFKTASVTIGDNCWIGANTVILRGTSIGDNCVIGAGCVVKGDIPANSLVTSGRELEIKTIK